MLEQLELTSSEGRRVKSNKDKLTAFVRPEQKQKQKQKAAPFSTTWKQLLARNLCDKNGQEFQVYF